MSEVGEDIPLVDGDACGREEAAVFGLRDERADDRDAEIYLNADYLSGAVYSTVLPCTPPG